MNRDRKASWIAATTLMLVATVWVLTRGIYYPVTVTLRVLAPSSDHYTVYFDTGAGFQEKLSTS